MNENYLGRGSVENNGKSAYYNGFTIRACPYKSGKKRKWWISGWYEARSERLSENSV